MAAVDKRKVTTRCQTYAQGQKERQDTSSESDDSSVIRNAFPAIAVPIANRNVPQGSSSAATEPELRGEISSASHINVIIGDEERSETLEVSGGEYQPTQRSSSWSDPDYYKDRSTWVYTENGTEVPCDWCKQRFCLTPGLSLWEQDYYCKSCDMALCPQCGG